MTKLGINDKITILWIELYYGQSHQYHLTSQDRSSPNSAFSSSSYQVSRDRYFEIASRNVLFN